MRIGIVSDTHGLLRPRLFELLDGVDHILHAGDLGTIDLLTELEAIAPVTIVWGNTDGMDVRSRVPEVATVELGEVRAVVMHGHQLGSPSPRAAAAEHPEADLVVFGHSHHPVIEYVQGVLAVNPGSAGPRRFNQPVTFVVASIDGRRISPCLIPLEDPRR